MDAFAAADPIRASGAEISARRILETARQQLAEAEPIPGGGQRLVLTGNILAQVLETARLPDAPAENAPESKAALRLAYGGTDPMIVQAHATMSQRPLLIGEAGGELSVKRHYVRTGADGSELVLHAGEVVARDEILDVILTIESKQSIADLSLTDSLPAGFEIIGSLPDGLRVDGQTLRAHLPVLGSPQTYRYHIRPTARGQFHALPARLVATYARSIDANSEEMIFLVK